MPALRTLAILLFGAATAGAVQAEPAAPMSFHIDSQSLSSALQAFSRQSHVQVLRRDEEVSVRGVDAPAISGTLTPTEALDRLLVGSGLTYEFINDRIVKIRPASSAPVSTPKRVAQSPSPQAEAAPIPTNSNDTTLAEVIVTAQKREERLQDVPVPVTVLSADSLVSNNQLLLKDYYSSVPGLSVTTQASGSFQTLSIRGITTGVYANPTVGITVDDVPFGTSTSNGGGGSGQIVPDIDPADLARVEVLRGPQGTLYGASSMGGLLKFVTVDPSTERLSGRVQADLNGVHNGEQLGYGVRGSVNVPLSDALALRASLFFRQDAGYIDNVQTGRDGVNKAQANGGRLSALWRPTEDLSLKLSALYQDIKGYGQPEVDVLPGFGDLQQSHLIGTGRYDRKVQAYSASLDARFGTFDFTSITGFNVMQFSDSYDLSFLYAPYVQDLYGVSGAFSTERSKTSKFTQELRLSTPIGPRFDWLVGAFYTHERSPFGQTIPAADVATGRVVGVPLALSFPAPTFEEIAAFTDLTVHVTDRFDVQVGGRESRIKETFSDVFEGPLVPLFYGVPSPLVQPELKSKANAFTYLVTPRLQISPDLMLYARLASGYRAGGSNYSAGPGTPGQYAPDKTYNYEVGLKGDFLQHLLSVDVSVYYIDWKKIQLNEFNPETGIGYFTNAGHAKSRGLELSVASKPLTGLEIDGWVAFDKATLAAGFPSNSAAFGASGDRLPYSSRFSVNVSATQEFPLAAEVTGFVGGAISYVGNREGEFTDSAVRQTYPGYAKTDLKAGAKYDSWTANVFVNNAADKRGELYGGLGGFPPFGFVYIQPRTIGVSVSKAF